MTQEYDFTPRIIKIDVEGAGHTRRSRVFSKPQSHHRHGVPARAPFQSKSSTRRRVLRSIGYLTYSMSTEGSLTKLDDIDAYLAAQQLDSDNIVFNKK